MSLSTLFFTVLFRSTLIAMLCFSLSPVFFVFPQLLSFGAPNWLLFALIFAVPHSVLALASVQTPLGDWAPYIYELSSDVGLLLLMFAWRRDDAPVWHAGLPLSLLMLSLLLAGWAIVFVWIFLPETAGRTTGSALWTTGLYSVVRHPLYVGFTMAFAFKPVMRASDLEFALCVAAYSLVGVFLEERRKRDDPEYQEYARRVTSRLLPFVF